MMLPDRSLKLQATTMKGGFRSRLLFLCSWTVGFYTVDGRSDHSQVSSFATKSDHPTPSGWEAVARAPQDNELQLSIGLKHGNFELLENELLKSMNRWFAIQTPDC